MTEAPQDHSGAATTLSPDRLALLRHMLEAEGLAATAPSPIQAQPPRAVDGCAPLAFAQERMWLLDRMQPGNPAYNLAAAIRLRGALDAAALEHGLHAIIRRHAVLRTTYRAVDGRPRQVIAADAELRLPIIALGGRPPPEREAELRRLAEQAAARPFDLERDLPIRATLVVLGPTEHVLLLTVHHIAADGWSIGVLSRELAILYASAMARAEAGAPPSAAPGLAELPIQYADFALWQRSPARAAVIEGQVDYWRRQLRDLPWVELPPDRPRPPLRTFRGGRVRASLSGDLAERLRALGRAEGASLFMTLLAGFAIVLQRRTGHDDIAIGAPIAGRDRPELEDLIGCFVNTLVLRVDLSGDPSFRTLVGRVREVCLDAYAHQDLPFERLLEALQPRRDPSRTPLFQVLFNMLTEPGPFAGLPGLEAEPIARPEPEAKFDLTLYVHDRAGAIDLDAVYDADLFDADNVAELVAQLDRLLGQAAAAPDRPIGALDLVTDAARGRLPDLAAPLPYAATAALPDGFVRQARRVPDRAAVVDAFGTWTYGELDAWSNRLANHLLAARLAPEAVVAIYGHRGAALVGAILGVLKAGAAFVVLDPTAPALRSADTLRSARPRAWLAVDAAGPVPPELADCLVELGVACRLSLPPRPGGAAAEPLAAAPDSHPGLAIGPRHLAYLAFTSGSSGRPRGILGEHGAVTHFLDWHIRRFELGEGDRFSLLAGLGHDPLLRDIFTPLSLGATLYVPPDADLSSSLGLAAWLKRHRISVAHLTPGLGQVLAVAVDWGGSPAGDAGLPDLRYAFFGGDVLTGADVDRFRALAPAATLVNFYGTTETPQAMACWIVPNTGDPSNGADPAGIVPIGRGIDGAQLVVLNAAGAVAGIGERGEIHVRSPHLSRGYIDDLQATRARFRVNHLTRDPGDRLYRTGDLGRHLPSGAVAFVGRNDRQVSLGGVRIELEEIEAVLARHPAVREVAALVHPADRAGADGSAASNGAENAESSDGRTVRAGSLVAYVAMRESPPTAGELREFARARLPAPAVPAGFVLLDALPLTPNGKLDHAALAALPWQAAPPPADGAPRTAMERLIVGLWLDLLGVDEVRTSDNFFDLGGSSLLAMQVLARLEARTGVRLDPRELGYQTAGQLAAACEAAAHATQALRA